MLRLDVAFEKKETFQNPFLSSNATEFLPVDQLQRYFYKQINVTKFVPTFDII